MRGYALLAPSLFGMVTFLLLPMLVVAWLSLQRWDLLGPIEYVGLTNWRSVLTDATFARSLGVTVLFIALVVPIQTALGLFAAAMLARGLPGSGFFRTLYVLPWICSSGGTSSDGMPAAMGLTIEPRHPAQTVDLGTVWLCQGSLGGGGRPAARL